MPHAAVISAMQYNNPFWYVSRLLSEVTGRNRDDVENSGISGVEFFIASTPARRRTRSLALSALLLSIDPRKEAFIL